MGVSRLAPKSELALLLVNTLPATFRRGVVVTLAELLTDTPVVVSGEATATVIFALGDWIQRARPSERFFHAPAGRFLCFSPSKLAPHSGRDSTWDVLVSSASS